VSYVPRCPVTRIGVHVTAYTRFMTKNDDADDDAAADDDDEQTSV